MSKREPYDPHFSYMEKREYQDLNEMAAHGNEMRELMNELREMAGGMYPDTVRDTPRIADLEELVTYFERSSQDYISAIRKLISEDKGENS